MKRGRSTGAPTKEEAARIVAVKEGPCIACFIHCHEYLDGCDAHHILSGGRRIGHMATIGLCAWHHRGVPYEGCTASVMREELGPSLMDGSLRFRQAYGTNEALVNMQNEYLAHGVITVKGA